MNLGLSLILVHFVIVIAILALLLWIASRKIFRILEAGKISPLRRLFIKTVSLPSRFIRGIFKKEETEDLSSVGRLSHSFVHYCSRIPYFHFFPKFLVATASEFLIEVFTGNHVLTGIVSLWSFSFLAIFTIVESRMGELEKRVVTMANFVFFRISILITIGAILIGKFFWKPIAPYFNNDFWHGIASLSAAMNEYLRDGWAFFWNLHPAIIIAVFSILGIYVFFSLQEKEA